MKALTTEVFNRFHGVPQLSKHTDFPVTDWNTYNPEDLPLVEGTETRQVRLDWEKRPRDPHNASIIHMLAKWAKEKGADLDPEYGIYLKDIALADLDCRFKEKFSRLQRVFKKTDGGGRDTKFLNRAKGVSRYIVLMSRDHS